MSLHSHCIVYTTAFTSCHIFVCMIACMYMYSSAHYDRCLHLTLPSRASPASSGPFLNQLLLICGLCNAADAVEILCVSFVLPHASSDLNMSCVEKGWLAAMIFVGMMLGGWCWGTLSDRIGRRTCLLLCLLINGLGGLAAALAPNFALMLVCRFISGVGSVYNGPCMQCLLINSLCHTQHDISVLYSHSLLPSCMRAVYIYI